MKSNELRTVTISIIDDCNYSCIWCFESENCSKSTYMESDDIIKVLHQIDELPNCRHITFTGGEPLLHPNLIEIINYSHDLGLHTTITSNGSLLTEKFFNKIKNKKLLSFAISVDGNEKTHDRIRGEGTFKKAIDAIRLCSKQKVDVSSTTTISKINYEELEQIVPILIKSGCQSIYFQRMRGVGKGSELSSVYLNHDENKDVTYKILSLSKKYSNKACRIAYKDPFVNIIDEQFKESMNNYSQKFIVGGCRAGISYLFVTTQGDVLPCPFLRISIGNINDNHIEKIWVNTELLTKFRNKNNYAKCRSCENWNICRGCRAEAYIQNNDLFSDDPGCWVEFNEKM